MKFIKFEDFGTGICAVFSQEPEPNYEYDSDLKLKLVWIDTCEFNRSSLEERAANLEKDGFDTSLERRVLADWPTISS